MPEINKEKEILSVEVNRKGGLVEIWIPPVGLPEGELICTIHPYYIPSLIASLKRFEQKEGR